MHLPVTALRTRPPLPPRTAVGARPERSEPWGRHGNATPGRCAPCRPCGGARPVAVLPAAPQPAYLTRAELGVLQQRGAILSFLGLHLVPAARSAQRAQRQLAGRHRREAQTRLAAPQPTGTAPPCPAALCPAGAGQRPPQPGGHVMGADGRKRPQPQLGAAPGPSAAAIFGKGSARRAGRAGGRGWVGVRCRRVVSFVVLGKKLLLFTSNAHKPQFSLVSSRVSPEPRHRVGPWGIASTCKLNPRFSLQHSNGASGSRSTSRVFLKLSLFWSISLVSSHRGQLYLEAAMR